MVVSYGVDLRKPRLSIDHLLSHGGRGPPWPRCCHPVGAAGRDRSEPDHDEMSLAFARGRPNNQIAEANGKAQLRARIA